MNAFRYYCDRCSGEARFLCVCDRCEREPEPSEKFCACLTHRPDISKSHRYVRGTEPRWMERTFI